MRRLNRKNRRPNGMPRIGRSIVLPLGSGAALTASLMAGGSGPRLADGTIPA